MNSVERRLKKIEMREKSKSLQGFLGKLSDQELSDMILGLECYFVTHGVSVTERIQHDSQVSDEARLNEHKASIKQYRQQGRDGYLRAFLPVEYDCPHCGTRVVVDVELAMESGLYPSCKCRGAAELGAMLAKHRQGSKAICQ